MKYVVIFLGSLMDFPPESVELLSLDNRIEMVKYFIEV